MEQSESIVNLATAIVGAQGSTQQAAKDSTNPFFSSRYTSLASCWEALAPWREWGIAITQSPAEAPAGYIALETQLTHGASGEWMRSRLVLPLAQSTPQGAGSCLTYARRYALCAMTGLVSEEDDDGNAASHHTQKYASESEPVHSNTKPSRPVLAPSLGVPTLQFGKHAGLALDDTAIPRGYLQWLLDSTENKIDTAARVKFRAVDEQLIVDLKTEIRRREIEVGA